MKMRSIKIKDENGNTVEVTPGEIVRGPIVHSELSPEVLANIGSVHTALKDVLMINDRPLCLEQFEVQFMRDRNPENELVTWEMLVEAYGQACKRFPADITTRRSVFQILLIISMGGVTPEDMMRRDFIIINQVWEKVHKEITEQKARSNNV